MDIGIVNPKNAKWQCSGCDYLCSLLTPADAVPPILCAIFSDKNNDMLDTRWRQIRCT